MRASKNIVKQIIKHALNYRIVPNSLTWRALFSFFRALYDLGLWFPNSSVEVLITQHANLILLPLSGSSTLRGAKNCKLSDNIVKGLPVFIVCRSADKRMQSFYNKKVRNPDTIGKCILLAGCSPLKFSSSVDTFLSYLESMPIPFNRDKHLWSAGETLTALKLSKDVVMLDLTSDVTRIENLLGQEIPPRCNTTHDVSTFQSPVSFKKKDLSRINDVFNKIERSMGWLS